MASIVAIYARENGAGTVFDMEDAYMIEGEQDELSSVPPSMKSVDDTSTLPPSPKSTTGDKAKRKNHLTVVK